MRKGWIPFDAAQSFIAPNNTGLEPNGGEELNSKRVRRRQVKYMLDAYVISLPYHHQSFE